MRQASGQLALETRGKRLYGFTDQVSRWVAQSGIGEGLLTLFLQHTPASLLIQENYDPHGNGVTRKRGQTRLSAFLGLPTPFDAARRCPNASTCC